MMDWITFDVRRSAWKIIPLEKNDGFYYFELGNYYHKSGIVWVHKSLVERISVWEGFEHIYEVFKPGVGKRIIKTEKGNYVIRPDPNYAVIVVGWVCGTGGGSKYQILTPLDNDEIAIPFEIYHSRRGSVGISRYALLSVKKDKNIKVYLTRTGRTYGAPNEVIRTYIPTMNGWDERDEIGDDIINLMSEK